jgi:glycosyltransferase involved in cell wall biosynthesis
MKIMEIVSGAEVNGAIRHCLLLTRELARRGNSLTVVCRPDSWIGQQLAADPVEVIHSDLHRWPTDELRRLADLLHERQIDVIHTHMSRAHFFGVLLRWYSGVPCVATAHNRLIQLHWMFNDLVIAVSDATRRFHRRLNFVSPRRIVTIHNFVGRDCRQADGDQVRAKIRREFGVGPDAMLVGAVGNLEPRKGLTYLLRALQEVAAAEPLVRLVIVGGYCPSEHVGRLHQAAQELGIASRIIWTGHRDDVADILSALDVYVSASLEESLPLTILEALAAGLPVVATAVGGVPECIADGQTGLLVAPANSKALAAAILAVSRSAALRQQLGQAGRQFAVEHFSAERQTIAIEAAFARVVRRAA